jgi:hypothetical protein
MAGEKKGASLEDIEAEMDKMDAQEASGERTQPILGAADDDVEVMFAAEDGETDERPAPAARTEEEGKRAEEGAEQRAEETEETGEAEDDPELAGYSKGIRARIGRETRMRRAAEAREEAERTARVNAETRAQGAELAQAELTLKLLEDKISAEEAKLKKAKTDGKVDDEVAASRAMGDLQAQRHDVERARDHLKTMKPAPAANPLVHTWSAQNRWFNNPEFAPESAMVKSISADIAAKFPPNTQEHFDELDRELRKRVPNLAARVRARLGASAIKWEKGERQAPQNGSGREQRPGPRLGAPSAGFGRSASGKRQVVLTRADTDNMRRVRLDPENPKHVLQYAREKSRLS